MGRVKIDEIDRYGGQGGAGFFSLKDDGDTARVRILYDSIEDIEAYAVHKVNMDGAKFGRYVSCLRSYDEPHDKCPFCRDKVPQQVRLFIPLYNIDEDKIQIWDRGKKFAQKLTSLCHRYPNLVSHVFEIERNGKAGSQQTTYEIYETDEDDTTLEDFAEELPDVFGGVVLEKSADDMEYFLDTMDDDNYGEFPPEDNEDTEPVRRRGSKRGTDSVDNSTDSGDSEETTETRRRGRDTGNRRSNAARSGRRTPGKKGGRHEKEDEF